MTSLSTTEDFTFTSRYPLTGNQITSIIIATVLPIALAVFLAYSAASPSWLVLALVGPVAGWYTWRVDTNRKKQAGVTVSVKDGVMTCATTVSRDLESDPVNLANVAGIAFGEPNQRKIIMVTTDNDEDGNYKAVRIPARAFTPGNPIGPCLKKVAEAKGITISPAAAEYLNA